MIINPQYIRECYIKHNLKPRAGTPNVRDGKCCAIGVIAIEQSGNTNDPYQSFRDAFPEVRAGAFFCGFDDVMNGMGYLPSALSKESYNNGRAVAEAVLDLK